MKFDLFDAMKMMKHHFGDDGEILLTQEDSWFKIRLRVFKFGEFHNFQFIISELEIADSYVDLMNLKFRDGILALHSLIHEYKESHGE